MSGCVTSIITRCGTCCDPSSVTSGGGGGGGGRSFLLLGFLLRRGDLSLVLVRLFVKASSSSDDLSSSELVFRWFDRFLILELTLVPFLVRRFMGGVRDPRDFLEVDRGDLPELRERTIDRGDNLPTGETIENRVWNNRGDDLPAGDNVMSSSLSSSDFDLDMANPVNPATSMSVSTKSSSSNSFPRRFRYVMCLLTVLASHISFSFFCFRAADL
jgi:hypothetical protein